MRAERKPETGTSGKHRKAQEAEQPKPKRHQDEPDSEPVTTQTTPEHQPAPDNGVLGDVFEDLGNIKDAWADFVGRNAHIDWTLDIEEPPPVTDAVPV